MQIRNSVTLIGNVGQLPVTKTLSSGNRLIEFSLATNESYRNRDGQKVQRTEWHRIKAFGKVVDVLERYLTRGSRIALTGSIRYNKWTDKYEQARVSTDIILDGFTFLDSRDYGASETEAVDEDSAMQIAEPSPAEATSTPAKTKKRRATKKSTNVKEAATAAEDLPF